jgi:hypothetical protein
MHPNDDAAMDSATKTTRSLSLSELLQRSLEEDAVVDPHADERERWDDDEGAFGG